MTQEGNVGQRSRSREKTRRLFMRVIKKTLGRREELTVSQWAEKYRILDNTSNLSGKWSNDITPYLVGIMDTFNDPYIREIYFCKSSQIGGTEALINIVCYIVAMLAAPTMIVYPSDDLAKDISNDKLKPAFRLIPEIRRIFQENASKELKLNFGTMSIFLRGSGSPSKLASKAIKYLFFDEIDKMAGASKNEASPYNLAIERVKTYKSQSKIYACSTPTLKTNYIWNLHENADEVRHFFVPCPHCGTFIELKWKQVKFEKDEEKKMSPSERSKTAKYICQECGHGISDNEKPKMLREGRWIAVKKIGIENPKTVGFWINSLYSIFVNWADVVEEFLKSQGDPEKLQNFINSWLAEPWEDTKLKTSDELVLKRQTNLEEFMVPEDAKILTAGVDVQETSLYWTIRAWSNFLTSQNIAHGQAFSFGEIANVMNLEYKKPAGAAMVVSLALIDSGNDTDSVYEFCADNSDWAYPCKGASNKMLTHFKISKVNKADSKAYGMQLIIVDGGKYKDMIAARMQRENGRGAWMVYKGCDTEYAKQVTAEQKVNVRATNGTIRQEWKVKTTHADNHYLDAEVYAAAAGDILGIRYMHLEREAEEQEEGREERVEPEGDWIKGNQDWIKQ